MSVGQSIRRTVGHTNLKNFCQSSKSSIHNRNLSSFIHKQDSLMKKKHSNIRNGVSERTHRCPTWLFGYHSLFSLYLALNQRNTILEQESIEKMMPL